jgi:hypothetical protein
MIKYEYINKEWIVSPTARRVYRTAAVVSLTIYFTLAAILMNGPIPALRQLLFVGVVATAIITIGMEFFLFRFDDSRGWMQIFWFCVMLFPPVGPALYCFLVYSGSKAVLNALATRSDDISSAVK